MVRDSWEHWLVRLPFVWYGKAFLRMTAAISRRQEFAADTCAARRAGPVPARRRRDRAAGGRRAPAGRQPLGGRLNDEGPGVDAPGPPHNLLDFLAVAGWLSGRG